MNAFDDWAKAKKYIEAALEHSKGTHTIDDVCLMVGAGVLKLWALEKSAMLTEFLNFPRMKVLNVFIAGGDLDELLKLEQDLMIYAKDNGCAQIREMGRKGWAKVLPGVHQLGTALYREV